MLGRKYLFHFLLIGLVLTVIASNFFWLKFTDMVIPFISAPRSLVFYECAFRNIGCLPTVVSSFTYYPPLHPLFIMLYHSIFGPEKFVPMAVNSTCLIIALISVYMICKRISGSKAGLLAAFITITYPAVFILARTDHMEYMLFSLIALALYFFVCTQSFKNRKYSVLLGIVLGLGMLTKWTYAAYIAGAFFFSILLIFTKEFEKKQLKNLILTALIAVMISAVWYIRLDMRYFFGSIGNEAENLLLSDRIFFFFNVLKMYISLPYTILFIGALLIFIINIKKTSSVFFVLLLLIITPYVIFSLIPHVEPRYFLPVLSQVSCLTSLGVFKIPNRLIRRTLVSVIILIGLSNLVIYFDALPLTSGLFRKVSFIGLKNSSKIFEDITQVINDSSGNSKVYIATSPFNGFDSYHSNSECISYRLSLEYLNGRNRNIRFKGFGMASFKEFPYEIDNIDFLIVTERALEDDYSSNQIRSDCRKFAREEDHNVEELYKDDPSYRKLIMDNFVFLEEFPLRSESNVLLYKNKQQISNKV